MVERMVSLSVGILLSTSLLHALPEAFESDASIHSLFATLLAGLLGFFLLEKFAILRHSHHYEGDGHDHEHGHDAHEAGKAGWMILVGDGLHNFTDGILIAAAFLADPKLGVITALADTQSEIFSEALNHASLIDGARLSRAKISVYPHCDLEALEKLLASSTAHNKLVVTDSVFSMDGNIAPLPELLTLCERHGAWLIVDDAHGFGVLGEQGRGALEHFALRSPQIVLIGTLSKAAGVAGAFVAAHETVIEWLVQRARPYIYSTASPPALAHALLASLQIIAGDEGRQRRQRLAARIAQWRHGLGLSRWQRLDSSTAIQPVIIGDNEETMAAGRVLRERGFWVGSVRPPTVPKGTSRLRVTLSAAHSDAQLSELITSMAEVEALTARTGS